MTYLRKAEFVSSGEVPSRHLTERKVYCCFENVCDREQFSHLARQVLLHDSKVLSDAYLHATKAPHGYMVLDLSQDMNDSLRFRTCVFPK